MQGLPYLLLAPGAHPQALGRCLEGRVQAGEVVGPRAGAAGLQVGPSLTGSTVLIVGDLVLQEGRRGVSQARSGGEGSWQLTPHLPVTQLGLPSRSGKEG